MNRLSAVKTAANTNLFRIVPRFRDALVKLRADTVVSCMWYPAIIADLVRKLRLFRFQHIVHDTVNMTEYIKDHFVGEKYQWLKRYLTKEAYCNANAVVVVSRGEKKNAMTASPMNLSSVPP